MPKKRHINNLKKLIKKYDTDQKGISKLLGVRESNLSAWINGKTEIPPYIVKAMEIHLDFSQEAVDKMKQKLL